MGEAKRRGTYDERCAAARAETLRRAIEAREARVRAMTEPPPRGVSKSRILIVTSLAFLATQQQEG